MWHDLIDPGRDIKGPKSRGQIIGGTRESTTTQMKNVKVAEAIKN